MRGRVGTRHEMWRDAIAGIGGDIKFGARSLLRSPGFVTIALSSLALGLGLTAVAFTFVDAVRLRDLPFPDPDRLVAVHERDATGAELGVTPETFRAWRSG